MKKLLPVVVNISKRCFDKKDVENLALYKSDEWPVITGRSECHQINILRYDGWQLWNDYMVGNLLHSK